MPIELESSRQSLVDAARRFRPRASPSAVSVLGEGQLTIALSIDGHVLRFPRSEFARGELRREAGVLSAIRPFVSATLPEIVADELDRDIGEAFVAHLLLPGQTLTRSVMDSLAPDLRFRIAEHVASFLRELHAVPPERVPMAPVCSIPDFATALRADAFRLLWPRLTSAGRQRAERELASMAALPDELSVPCASDIGGNIVYDAGSGSVSFIDFGDTIVSDPVLDAASLSALDDNLALACGRLYPVVADRLERAGIVRHTFVLQDALYGARQGDWTYVDAILREYDPATMA